VSSLSKLGGLRGGLFAFHSKFLAFYFLLTFLFFQSFITHALHFFFLSRVIFEKNHGTLFR